MASTLRKCANPNCTKKFIPRDTEQKFHHPQCKANNKNRVKRNTPGTAAYRKHQKKKQEWRLAKFGTSFPPPNPKDILVSYNPQYQYPYLVHKCTGDYAERRFLTNALRVAGELLNGER